MAVGKTKVDAAAWARASLEGFQVTGDLFGHGHIFTHNGRLVEIRVPEVKIGPDMRPIGRYREVAAFRSGRAVDPQLATTSYEVEWIDVSITVKEKITTPTKLLEMSPKRPEIAGPKLTNRLDALVVEYEGRIARALDHWEAVVRWISGSSALGSPSAVAGRESALRLNFMSLVRASDKHQFWTPTNVISALGSNPVTAPTWQAVGSALSAGHAAPIWFRYVDEAYHRHIGWDLSGAVLSCAIACETLAREGFWLASGSTTRDAARDLIDRVPIRAILNRWGALTGITKTESRIADVGRLFDARNRLMHAGGKEIELGRLEVQNFVTATRSFVRTGDDWYYRERGVENPRLFVGAA